MYRTQAASIAKATGCKGIHPLLRLPHIDPIEQIDPDAMHTIKDVVERMFALIIGKDTSETKEKITNAEEAFGRTFCTGLGKRKQGSSAAKSSMLYQLTSESKKIADQRCEAIIVPSHVDYSSRPIFCKKVHFKSHDWKQVCGCYCW